jgi:hypothetical protein
MLLEKGDVMIGGVLLTKRAALLSPRLAAKANNMRFGLDERMSAAESAEAMVVALAQPHRLGDRSKFAGDALALFCVGLRRECHAAGEAYCRKARAEKSARGFHVVDQAPGEAEPGLTFEQIEAKHEAAIMAFRDSNGVLTLVHPRCPRRMELLCYDRLPPSPYDEGMLRHGLFSLARHYGLLDEGINRDRP